MNVNIKTLFISIGCLFIIVAVLFVVAITDLSKASQELKAIEHNRFVMLGKADELRQSSDDLTKYARLYASTSDKQYKDIYFHILDIRNGAAQKPLDYESIYWEISEPIRSQRHPLGEPSSLRAEMEKLPYLPLEFEKLKKAELYSNELVQLEVEAFNAMDGLFKDNDGSYTIKNSPTSLLAVNLLNSKQYLQAKEKIMLLIDDFLHSLSSRTSLAIGDQNTLVSLALSRIQFLLFITLSIFIFTAVMIKKKIFNPIQSFTETITSFKMGEKIIKRKKYFNDEIGFLTENFYDMKKAMDDDLGRLNLALNAGNQGWFDLNPQTGDISVSDECAKILGYQLGGFGTNLQEWHKRIHPNDLNDVLDAAQECLRAEKAIKKEYRLKNKNGDWIWLQFIAEVVEFDSNNKPIRIIGVTTDITERKKHEVRERIHLSVFELLASNAPLQKILNSILSIIEIEDPHIRCSILLLDREGKHLLIGAAPSLPDFYNQAIEGLEIGNGVGSCGTAAFTQKRVIVENINTHPYWELYKELAAKADLGSCWSEPVFDSNGAILATFAIYHRHPSTPSESDLKLIDFVSQLSAIAIERSRINEQMLLSTRVFSDTHEGISLTDPTGAIIDVNPAFCEITGYSREDVIGKNPKILSSGKQSPEFYKEMWQQIINHDHWQGEVWNRKKNGESYAQLLTISAIKNDNDIVINYVGLFTDITHSKQQQEQLELMAHYDVLTKLPNRTLFIDRFNQAIAHSKRSKKSLAVCFLDLDNFKPVNDNYGHETGDQLLIEVAQRISENIREEDTVSRQGGDEFALLLGDIDSLSHCEQTLDRIHFALSEPYIFNGISHQVTASSGFTLFPSDNGDIDTLLRHADQAMYQAKLLGKHQYYLFNAEQDQKTIYKHSQLEEIQRALTNNEFQLYYQPKVNMKTGEVFGAEALIRWIHPEKGVIPPLDFLPLIEGTSLELEIGSWVINEALRQLDDWNRSGIKIQVSINVSSHHLQSTTFLTELENLLCLYSAIDSKQIQLEILESSVLSNLESISKIIKTCRRTLGINIALDDFGTGYSSLTHLRNLSANTIKIDQTFVRDLLEDPSDYSIIDGIIGLADSFGREIIAEGVETTEQGLVLLLMGCEEAQGYGISRPIPAPEFLSWLAAYNPNQEWLACASGDLSLQQRKLNIFKLTISQWKKQFEGNIQSSPENAKNWPIMDKTKCSCGMWIRQAQREQLFEEGWLTALKEAHDNFHSISDDLLLKYHDGRVNETQKGLTKLQVIYDKIDQLA